MYMRRLQLGENTTLISSNLTKNQVILLICLAFHLEEDKIYFLGNFAEQRY